MKSFKILVTLCVIQWSMAAFADFTIGVFGDTQYLTESENGGDMLKAMARFFVDRKEELNVVFVISVGDMTNNKDVKAEWDRIKKAYEILWDAGIPYSPCQGNHDAISSLNEWFPVRDFERRPYWGGSMNGGIENAFYLFSAENMDFLLLVGQHEEDSGVKNWANGIYSQYPGRRAMHVNHYLEKDSWVENNIIEKHDHIFMAFSGHDCRLDGEEYWTSTSPGGNTQHLTLSDYQCRTNLGAFVRYYTFKPDEDRVTAFTYNVMDQTYEVDESSYFYFDYDMEPSGDQLPHHLQVSAGAGGIVKINPLRDGGNYEYNTPVTLTAQPSYGYQFDRWTGHIAGFHNPAVIQMDADKSVAATFKDCSLGGCVEELRFLVSSYGQENLSSGMVNTTDEFIYLPRTNDGIEQAVGLNFNGIELLPGTRIISSYIQFYQSTQREENRLSLDIWGDAADNSAAFTPSNRNVTGRARTIAKANWKPARWKREYRIGTSQQSAYLTSIIQELVDRTGWAKGNSVSIILQRADDGVGGTQTRKALAIAELVIQYDPVKIFKNREAEKVNHEERSDNQKNVP